ncbi:MAG TPA: DUF4173 domain-containing protein [Micromonosporaceae bacterium]
MTDETHPTPPPTPAVPPPRPPSPSALRRRWAGAGRQAGTATALAALLGAAVVAAGVPLERPGVGWLLCGVAAAAALSVAARTAHPRIDQLLWGAATLVLLAVGTLRAAGWLFALCLLTALVTGCLAVTGGRSVRGMLLGFVLIPAAVVRAVPWAGRGLAHGGRGSAGVRVAITAGISIVLLLVFGLLFASADAVFADLLDQALPDLGPLTVVRVLLFFPPAALVLFGGAYLLAAPPDLTGLETPAKRRVRRLEWLVPILLLDVLFTVFVLVQLTVLFGGARYVLTDHGPTFAEYARSGFWQLLAVTVLTLPVLGGAARWAPRDNRLDRILIRVLLGALAVLTLVIVASALYRMHVYQQAYGFTRLRILVSAYELWLGFLFVLVLAAGIHLRATWLPRVAAASAVLALLGLVALDPDRFIADQNIDRYQATGRIDVDYLSGLSADAVPALDRLPGQLRDCALSDIAEELTDHPDGWRGWNLARRRALDLLAADPPQPSDPACSAGYR